MTDAYAEHLKKVLSNLTSLPLDQLRGELSQAISQLLTYRSMEFDPLMTESGQSYKSLFESCQAQYRDSVARLEGEKNTLKSVIISRDNKISDLTLQLNNAASKINELSGKIQEKDSLIALKQKTINEYNEKIKLLTSELNNVGFTIATLRDQLELTKPVIEKLSVDRNNALSLVDQMKVKVSSVEQHLEQKDSLIIGLQKDKDILAKKIADFYALLEQYKETARQNSQVHETLKLEIGALNKRIGEFALLENKLLSDISLLKQEVTKKQTEINNTHVTNKSLKDENALINKQYENAVRISDKLAQDIKIYNAKSIESNNMANVAIAQKKEVEKQYTLRLQELENARSRTNEVIAQLQKERLDAGELATCKAQLASRLKEIEYLTNKLHTEQYANAALNKEVKQLVSNVEAKERATMVSPVNTVPPPSAGKNATTLLLAAASTFLLSR